MDKEYIQFITELKQNIVQSRYIAARLANKEQLLLYFKTGRMLSEKIAAEKWGMKIVEQIADDLQKQLPGLRGFSYRNLMNMRHFFIEYQSIIILQSLAAELKVESGKSRLETPDFKDQFLGISFTHHMTILNKCKINDERCFYIQQAFACFWSVSVLEHHISANLYSNQGKLPNNFSRTLPEQLKPSALQVFQDEYLMDFIHSSDSEDERQFEDKVVADIKNFIMRIGKGFAFIGNQYRLEVGGEEFFVDLLFFNRHLQSLVVFELKRGKFKPEYAGQLNFYLNVLDEKVRLEKENASIGIVLCKEKNNTAVEFAVKTIDKAMGVATYRTTKEVPKEMKGILPDTVELAKLL
jgi:predicted nuclease of restriction endonuclease-like (RecB) superfamily